MRFVLGVFVVLWLAVSRASAMAFGFLVDQNWALVIFVGSAVATAGFVIGIYLNDWVERHAR